MKNLTKEQMILSEFQQWLDVGVIGSVIIAELKERRIKVTLKKMTEIWLDVLKNLWEYVGQKIKK